MQVVTVNKKNWKKELKGVIDAMQNGAIVVFPTETSYGIGGDPKNKIVVEKINTIKKRPSNKFLPCVASSFYRVQQVFYLSNIERKYAKKHWPGPYTILLRPRHDNYLKLMYPEIAVRVSAHQCARYLAKKLGGFSISTSANISGNKALYSAQEVCREFKNQKLQPDYIVDWGRLPKRSASSIVKFEDGKIFKIR